MLRLEEGVISRSFLIVIFQDEYLTVADEVGLSPREACGVLLGSSCGDPYDPWNQEWNITVPGNKPPIQPIPNPKVGETNVSKIIL